jgi:hypothetical protein
MSPYITHPSISPRRIFAIISVIMALHMAAYGFIAISCVLANWLPRLAATLKSAMAPLSSPEDNILKTNFDND